MLTDSLLILFKTKTSGIQIKLVILFYATILAGCATFGTTTPNKPYMGAYPAHFQQLMQENYLLAEEIGKLPELQDGIQQDDELALITLSNLYKKHKDFFNNAFIEMYQEGLPSVRKYCSPLQAFFWIAKNGKTENLMEILENYSLKTLLSKAWQFDPPQLSDSEISEIITSLGDYKLRQEYLKCREQKTCSNQHLQNYLMIDYRLNPGIFSGKSKDLLESKKSYRHPSWSDFQTVVERLNSPELVNYYEQAQTSWVDWRTLPRWPVSPWYVFKYKEGDCTAIADFTALCLTRAGYRAYEHKVAPTRSIDSHHSICIFYDNGIKYAMDNGSSFKKGIYIYD